MVPAVPVLDKNDAGNAQVDLKHFVAPPFVKVSAAVPLGVKYGEALGVRARCVDLLECRAGILPFLVSLAALIVGVKMALWLLTKLFSIYSWIFQRNFSMLLLLTCIALMMTTQQLQKIPSYV